MQRIMNKGIEFINHNDQEILTVQETHAKYNISPFNRSRHNKALPIWERIRHTQEHLYDELIRPRRTKHSWFPRTSDIIHAPPPLPIYTSN